MVQFGMEIRSLIRYKDTHMKILIADRDSLSHPTERKDIAVAGWEKIQREFSMESRVKEMLEYV